MTKLLQLRTTVGTDMALHDDEFLVAYLAGPDVTFAVEIDGIPSIAAGSVPSGPCRAVAGPQVGNVRSPTPAPCSR